MRDREVVEAIVAGDPAGLAEAYDRYADPLFNFCRAILHEPADAADVVHDTFVIAACRLSGLEDPERLRSWLYAVARNECLQRLRGVGLYAPLEKTVDITDEAADVTVGPEQAELRALVREALNGVGPAEREVLELQIHHGLTNGETASVLGVSRNHLHALLSRARDQLENSLGVLVLSRTGRRDCPVLDAMLEGENDQLTILLRKRVNQHVRRCVVCSERRQRELSPAMLLGVSPIVALPLAATLLPAFRDAVLRAATGTSPAAVAHRAVLSRTGYPFGSHGFPRPLAPPRAPWWHLKAAHAGLAGTAAAAVSVATIAAMPIHHHGPRPDGGHTASGTGTAGLPAGGIATVSPKASGTSGTGGTAAATAVPAGGVASLSTATPTVTVSATVSATVTPGPASGTLSISPATLYVTSSAPGTITLTATGGPVDWSVTEPKGLTQKVIVSPMSGTLADGETTTVSVTVDGPGHMHVHLVFSPGGSIVTVEVS